MRYLTLAADYTQSALRDDYLGTVVPEEIGIADSLAEKIRDWNKRYRSIIPLDQSARSETPVAERIGLLDEEGLRLVAEIEEQLGEVKVRYFSEGHLRYVT